MSGNVIKISETLMLRRIDPIVMLTRYLAGDFKSLKIPTSKVAISSAFINLNQSVGINSTSEIFKFNDKTNAGQLVITTNHNQYKYYKEKNEGKNPPKPISLCGWCRRNIKNAPIGIPTSMTISNNMVIFDVEDTYDTFGCALAALKKIYGCHRIHKDPLYIDAEQLLHCLYFKMYPEKQDTRIREAPDWRLLKINGGPFEDSEYDSDRYEY